MFRLQNCFIVMAAVYNTYKVPSLFCLMFLSFFALNIQLEQSLISAAPSLECFLPTQLVVGCGISRYMLFRTTDRDTS